MNIIHRVTRSLIVQSTEPPSVGEFADSIVEMKARAPLGDVAFRIIMHPETGVDMLTRPDVRDSILMRYDGSVSCLGVQIFVDSAVPVGTFQLIAIISQTDTHHAE
tara:strand:+ start:585 stop:902 length:318 start_codon:yes stop_codon:yes gene_type:complete